MANEEQLAILKKGADVWNKWREKNPEIDVDLRWAHLRGANLGGADLRGADLRGAILQGADLSEVKLCEAKLEKAILTSAYLEWADLSEADLREAELGHADLCAADLSEAYLSGAYLRRAKFRRARLVEADLRRATLEDADFSGANLTGADLRRADLRQAILVEANLRRANLEGANFSQVSIGAIVLTVRLGGTVFADNDLSAVKGLETARHLGPSTVGIDTIYKSKGNIPEVFLRGCGVPEKFITFMHSLTGKAFDFYSCFISHSAKDKPFVERLHNDLQAKGVRTWYFPEDARSGKKVWGEIDESIKIYDKLVVVCSKNSLQSEPVVREMERALQREAKDRKDVLFPITLDRYIFDTWEHELKADLMRKVIGDFTGSSRSVPKYTKAFDKLLKDLQKG